MESGFSIIIKNNAHDKWEVLEVVDSQKTKKYKIQYKVIYVGNWDDWNLNPA